ncbi:cobalamin biosynthesis protein CobD [Phycicoccus sp. CSK15P-2]|uniref:adenosylcobinamide-phosphate synthase CbiB n=1 Tax=Phycicoccus sp. CSK15P-2 TaxID=2807627 RepID=UPI001952907F|nr:adenosylcobinamide-phosphate synthase CbiB [Phycicoccus sp. CSK15P-2]MBM6404221.1 cobalamin biosynthesis protein CobD [Phycicoccus sp. CSK15P-2]
MSRYVADPVAVGLVAGVVLDRMLGDPRRLHPVAGFGTLALRVERALYAPSRRRGAVAEGVLVGGAVLLGAAGSRLPPGPRALAVAAATWAVLGGRSLEREATAVAAAAGGGDLDGARQRVRSLVGRDPSTLDADGLARACTESLAENTVDAVVAPLLWGAVAGLPGLLGHRAVNTLDAMVGHRSTRYERYGWAAARVDDVAAWVPSRVTVLLTAADAQLRSGRGAIVVRTARRDGPRHPSPNAGPVEAAWAAALGIRLGGSNTYGEVVEDRGVLGDGPAPTVRDVPRATALLRRVTWAALGTAVGLRLARRALSR